MLLLNHVAPALIYYLLLLQYYFAHSGITIIMHWHLLAPMSDDTTVASYRIPILVKLLHHRPNSNCATVVVTPNIRPTRSPWAITYLNSVQTSLGHFIRSSDGDGDGEWRGGMGWRW